ncbi:class I SAM-dependent methyltransferase [Serratia fonticola]|uniref:class I SAM-dependent methyltransferase n=1 Tax=Serratia fonticola TaxID=47917 RepID=UPI0021B70799|nr:class I SAM-dependent methyltransferase [Serratia fonticola]
MATSPYEYIYQTLKKNGEPAWTGKGYERAWSNLSATLQSFKQLGFLPLAGGRCLELGCGNGAMASLWLARHGYRVEGVDISSTAIAWAKENFATEGLRGNFQQADVCALDIFGPQRFDMVYDGSCLHCLIGEQRQLCFKHIQRIMTSDGIFIISSMCGEPKRSHDRENYDAEHYQLYEDGRPWRTLMPLDLLREELLKQGFAIFSELIHENPWWDHATLCCRRTTSKE